MYSFINNKINCYIVFPAFYINSILHMATLYSLLINNLDYALILLIIKELWHYLIPKKILKKNVKHNFNYHIYNGITILLKDINTRKGILSFYVLMYYILLAMVVYLLWLQEPIGFIISIFVYISNFALNFVFYKLSKAYEE